MSFGNIVTFSDVLTSHERHSNIRLGCDVDLTLLYIHDFYYVNFLITFLINFIFILVRGTTPADRQIRSPLTTSHEIPQTQPTRPGDRRTHPIPYQTVRETRPSYERHLGNQYR